MKKIFITCILTVMALSVSALDNATVRLRADRYFSQSEWPSASAFYGLLIEQDTECKDIFGRAVISAMMIPDTASVLRFTNDAINRHVPFKSLFSMVKNESFGIGSDDAYENYLLLIKANYSWMTRTVDNSLMEYYTYRKDGKNMIKYAQIMLDGLPDDVKFMTVLAEGYLLDNQIENALTVYHRILEIAPDDYNTLLYLGNYYLNSGDAEKSKDYFRKAYAIKPTPYVKSKL